MKTNYTEFLVEVKADLGMELYKEITVQEEVIDKDGAISFQEVPSEIVTNRITAPLSADLTEWKEREIVNIEEYEENNN